MIRRTSSSSYAYFYRGVRRGWASLHTDGGIYDVTVFPEHRGHGFSVRMMRELLNVAHKRRLGRVFLWVYQDNVPAVRCYLRVGFRITGHDSRAYDDHRPRFAMELNQGR